MLCNAETDSCHERATESTEQNGVVVQEKGLESIMYSETDGMCCVLFTVVCMNQFVLRRTQRLTQAVRLLISWRIKIQTMG